MSARWSRFAGALFVVALLGMPLGCARSRPEPSPPAEEPAPSPSESPTPPPDVVAPQPIEPHAREAPASVYFMSAEKVAPAARVVEAPAVAASAMESLLEGPTAVERDQGLTTAIPRGTTLRSVRIDGGTATVDLSSEFGSGGGSLSMFSRVAQVVFTLTQFRTVDRVVIRVDGRDVEALGGEGLVMEDLQTRADLEEMSPAVLVEHPAWGAEVRTGMPVRVSGTANVFEAEFDLELADGDGVVVGERHVMATSGSGARGTFSTLMTMPASAKPGWGEIIAWYASAKDGSRVVVAEIPIRVSPVSD